MHSYKITFNNLCVITLLYSYENFFFFVPRICIDTQAACDALVDLLNVGIKLELCPPVFKMKDLTNVYRL